MADVSSSVSVSVGPPRDSDAAVNRRLSIRLFGDGEETNEILVDVFPSSSELDMSVTNGTLSFGVERFESVVEFLTFSDSKRAQLTHGDIENLTITKIGDFRSSIGLLLASNISYDGDTSELVLTQKVYGIVKVTYQAPFQRFIYKFQGSCPADRPEINDFTGEEEEIFERATIIATLPSDLFGVAVATLIVENSNDRCPFEVTTGEVNNLILEIVSASWSDLLDTAVEFETRFRIFPALDNTTVKNGRSTATVVFDAEKTFDIKDEAIQFNGSSSASIRYPIDEFGISNNLSGLIDEFGKEFPAGANQFLKAGSRVTKGSWDASGTFTPSGEIVIVKKGEVYVVSPSGQERPVTGVVTTSYQVTFREYVYTHVIGVQDGGTKKVAKHDIITARDVTKQMGGVLIIPEGFPPINTGFGRTETET